MRELRSYQTNYFESGWALAPAFYLGWEPRLGKTYAERKAILRRQREASVKRTLIVGPKNPLLMTWEDELTEAGYSRPSVGEGVNGYLIQLARGESIWRAEVLKDLAKGAADDEPYIVLINFDVLDDYFEPIETIVPKKEYRFRKKTFVTDIEGKGYEKAKIARANSTSKKIVDLLLDLNFQTLIVDEAHLISAAGAHRSRALRRLGRGAQFRRLLSGTPDPQRAPSFYAQYVVLAPEIFGTSKQKFLDRYFDTNPFIPSRIRNMKPGMRNEFYAKVYSIMSIVKSEDYFGPDDTIEVERRLVMPSEVRATYDTLQKDSVLASDSLTVDGTHRLTKLLRSLQLCAGFLEDENSGEVRWLHRAKEEAIIGDLSEILAAGERVVISYQFNPAGESIVKAINTVFRAQVAHLINGQTNNATDLLRLFDVNSTAPTEIKVLVIQEQVGGVGISLARARHLFFHSWSMDSAAHTQMRRRVWHPSRAASIAYYQMKDSADDFARAIVQDKVDASVMKSHDLATIYEKWWNNGKGKQVAGTGIRA
jgi:hypothetical protein